jgi:hypothetical protein
MQLTFLRKILLLVVAILFTFAWVFDGTPASLVFGIVGLTLIVYVIHTLPKRSIKCTDL